MSRDVVRDLIELADRRLAKVFADPWPPRAGKPADNRVVHHISRPRLPTPPSRASRTRLTCEKNQARRAGEIPKSHSDRHQAVVPSQGKHVRHTPQASPRLSPPQLRNARLKSIPRSLQRVYKARTSDELRMDDIKPDLDRCDVLLIAIAEMEICKELFAGWRAQLDLAKPHRKDKLEHSIFSTVDKLDIETTAALYSSHIILRNYRAVVRAVDRRLGEVAQSREGGSLFVSSEVQTFASGISAHSKSLAGHVKTIQDGLRELVRDIERTRERADKRALRRKIWGWLSKAFQALSVLLSAGGAIFSILHPLGLLGSPAIAAASMLSGAAARLCEVVQNKYSETVLDKILGFLRDDIPESAKAAELALTSFRACHRVLQLELEVRQGKRSGWLTPHDAKRARGHWSQAKQKLDVARPTR